jgi:beta-lactamase class D
MKITSIAIFLVMCFSCTKKNATVNKEGEEKITQKVLESEFQSIIDSYDVKGSILIYDLKEDTYYSNDFEWANKGNLPASTFKIANSIIGLETGVIENDSTIFKWDGEEKWLKEWEQDLVLKDAFQFSCVPCYQEVARKIGTKRMNEYVKKMHYGNLKIDSTNIDQFWLEGESRISQMQQIDFLKRFYAYNLPVSDRTQKIIRNVMLMEESGQFKLSGKTGLSNDNGNYNGWFVGFIEFENKTYLFATNVEPREEFVMDSFIMIRKEVTLKAFQQIGIVK